MSIELEMNIEVEELQRAFDYLPALMHRSVRYALERVGSDIHMDARRMCPVRTGRLRDSIYHKVEDWVLKVGARAPYARYVEFGTRYMYPRYFLTEACSLNLPRLHRVLNWALDAALKSMRWRG